MNFDSLINGKEHVPALTHDCVHVWRVSTAMHSGLDGIEESLSGEERAQAAQFHFEKDRRLFQVCRGSLRHLISLYTGKDAAKIQFHIGSHGKPALLGDDADGLRFNVSHSGEQAFLAFALGAEIGVDVEFKRADVDFFSLAEYVFSESEREALLDCAPENLADLFYEYWTCKEACIKADGRGLSIPLDEFTVTAVEGDPQWREMISTESSGLPSGMRSRILDTGEEYAAAVAANIPSWHVLELTLNPLLGQDTTSEPGCESVENLSAGSPAMAHVADKRRSIKGSSKASPLSVSKRGRK